MENNKTKVEKCDPIADKETPKIDTKDKAMIPAEELMIEKNGQWVLKKSDDSLEKGRGGVMIFNEQGFYGHNHDAKVKHMQDLAAGHAHREKLKQISGDELDQALAGYHAAGRHHTVKFVVANNPNVTDEHKEKYAESLQRSEPDFDDDGDETLEKSEVLEKPPVSEAQRRAMRAAAAGDSEIGIPKSVGKEFSEKDPGGKLPEKMDKNNGALSGSTPAGFPGERLRLSEGGQWDIEKVEMGRGGKPKDISMFTSDHINAVVKMPHADAKAHAHAAVDASSAKPENKLKAKKMIDSSKSSTHLAMGMGNFLLSSEGLGVGSKRG